MEAEALGIVWRVDPLVSDFDVLAAEVCHRLPHALLSEFPVRAAIEELDGDLQGPVTAKVPTDRQPASARLPPRRSDRSNPHGVGAQTSHRRVCVS